MTREMPLEAREHLLSVRPWADRDMFQTFAEAHNAQGAHSVLAPRWRLAPVLHRLNTDRGHGVYFAPSDFDRGRRWLVDVAGIRHLWLDLDGTPLPESWPLAPHCVTETSPGKFHVFWIVDDLPQDNETHKRLLGALCDLHGGDHGAKGANRVLRLAGYYHLKREPFLVRLVSVSDHHAWSFLEVKSAWPKLAIAALSPRPAKPIDADTLADGYVRAALEAECRRVATAPGPNGASGGARNTTLTSAAFSIGTLVGSGALDRVAAVDALLGAALEAGLPEHEARSTTERQVDAGMKHPRTERAAM